MKFHCFIILALACVTYGAPTCKFGFIRRNTTGAVDTDKVYKAHFEQFSSVDVFTADRLQVSVSCDFQYFLREDELTLLHKKYGLYYEPILRSNAMHALKGAATKFVFREYITDRKRIEKALFEAVRERLGGNCCIPGCGKNGKCRPGCKSQADCTDADRGLHADVRYFQLTKVHIPDDLIQRYLQALILQEDTETEKLRQEAHIICKETEAKMHQCPKGEHCELVEVQCITDPCDPVPTCVADSPCPVGDPNGSCSADGTCPIGYACIENACCKTCDGVPYPLPVGPCDKKCPDTYYCSDGMCCPPYRG